MSVPDSPARLWAVWTICSVLTLFVVGTMVLYGGQHGVWLFGWAVGMVISAVVLVFRRRT